MSVYHTVVSKYYAIMSFCHVMVLKHYAIVSVCSLIMSKIHYILSICHVVIMKSCDALSKLNFTFSRRRLKPLNIIALQLDRNNAFVSN